MATENQYNGEKLPSKRLKANELQPGDSSRLWEVGLKRALQRTKGTKVVHTPEELMNEARIYFEYCERHPFYKKELLRGGDKAGELVDVPTIKPFTLHGFCLWLGTTTEWFLVAEANAAKNHEQEWLNAFHVIRETIYEQKFTGAMVGAFNALVAIRDLGLKEVTELQGVGGTALIPPVNIIMPVGININLPSNTDGYAEGREQDYITPEDQEPLPPLDESE